MRLESRQWQPRLHCHRLIVGRMFDDGVQRGQAQHDSAACGWETYASVRTATTRQDPQPLAIGKREQRCQRLGRGRLRHHQWLHAQHGVTRLGWAHLPRRQLV